MRRLGIGNLFEAIHPSQMTGAYQVALWRDEDVEKIEWPVYYKNDNVLVADVVPEQLTVNKTPHATIYVFGTKQPYNKLRSFMDKHYGIELDEHDFGVGLLMDDRGTLPRDAFPDIKEVHREMTKAMAKAKRV